MAQLVVLDTETTGLDSPIRAVEVAALFVDDSLNVTKEISGRVNPGRPINPGAIEIHGISDEMVADCPPVTTYTEQIPPGFVAIGHNVPFDLRVLGEHLVWSGEVCTLALSRRWIKGTTNHKLDTLKRELKLPEQQSHSALGDCYTSLEVLKLCLNLSGKTLAELVALEQTPKMLPTMPFGKHRGKKFTEIPTGYLEWLLSLPDLHKDLAYTLKRLAIIRNIP